MVRMTFPDGFTVVHADGTEETEVEFLTRRRLLTRDEKTALAARAKGGTLAPSGGLSCRKSSSNSFCPN